MQSILIVEDEIIVAKDLEMMLRNYSYNVLGIADTGKNALELIRYNKPDTVLLDVGLKGELDGIETAAKIKEAYDIPCVILTAYSDENTMRRINRLQPLGYLTKPFEEEELLLTLKSKLKSKINGNGYFNGNDKDEVIKLLRKQLTEKNEELKQFIYIASHDMQEPLRMIASYVQLLQKKYEGQLDKDANEFIYYTVDGVNRMKVLISDLLTYSRLNTKEYKFHDINVHKVLQDILRDLNSEIKLKKASIELDSMAEVYSNDILLYQILFNLISNSLKFCDNKPVIHIGINEINNCHIVYIKDNGIGIEQQYKDKIFQPFQKLHSINEYQGTGIGLAICKKITDIHNGELWFEANEDSGVTFYFSLPKVKIN